jgi:cytochrome c5
MTRAGIIAAAAMVVAGAGTWLVWNEDDSSDRAARASTVSELDGAAVFVAKGCAVCHDGPDTSAMGHGFPSLAHAPEWAGTRDPSLTADEYLRQSVLEPGVYISPEFRGPIGGTDAMPRLNVSEDELDALVDHLMHRP